MKLFLIADKNTLPFRSPEIERLRLSELGVASEISSVEQAFIIVCELSQNEKGEPIPRQKLYGIELAKKLRKDGVNVPIVFTSFLSRKQVYSDKLERGIVNAIGSGFMQLPCKPDDLRKAAETIEPLSKLEMYDVVHNYCSSAGVIRMLLHSLRGYAGDDLKGKIKEAIQQAHSVFWQDGSTGLADFDNLFPEVTTANKRAALNFADEIGDRLIENYAPLEAGSSVVKAQGKWKILLLDDEIGQEHELVTSLCSREVEEVICARTAKEAEQLIEKDYHDEKRILLVVSDYRLEDGKDGIMVHQPKQGYRFIAEQTLKMPYLRFVALSALPRKFLMKSFDYYGVRVKVLSKKDYLENEATLNLLCDEIIELGNENAEAITRLPVITSNGWGDFVPFYFAHRSSPKYKENEQSISQRAKEYCEGIKKGAFPFQLDGYTVQLKGKKKIPSNTAAFDEFISKMICRRVAIWYSQYNKAWTIQDVHKIIKGKKHTGSETKNDATNQVNTNLALSLTDFPWNMTIEEKYWMMYDMGFGEVDELEKKETEVLQFVTGSLTDWLNKEGLKDDIEKETAFSSFFSGNLSQYGTNFSVLKNFLYKIYKHVQGNSEIVQSMQNLILKWQNSTKPGADSSNNVKAFFTYLEKTLRRRLKFTKTIDPKAIIKIADKEGYYKSIVAEAAKKISQSEFDEFKTNSELFFYDDLIDKGKLKTKKEWIDALVLFHNEQMDMLRKEGIDYDENKSYRKRKAKLEDDYEDDNIDDDFSGTGANIADDESLEEGE